MDKGPYKDLEIKGKSHNFFVDLSRRLVKTENYKLYGDIAFDMRNTETTMKQLGTIQDYKTRAIKLNLTSIKDDFHGKWFGNIGLTKGIDIFDATNDATKYSGPQAYGHHNPSNKIFKMQGSIARLQVLPWRMMGIFSANGQWINRNAWFPEQLQIGGISSVRGFEEGYFLRDYGATTSLELRAPVPFLNRLPQKLRFIDDSIRLAAFCDAGIFGHHGASTPADGAGKSDFVMSVGGGLVLKMTRYLSGNVYIGVPIVNRPDEASKLRVHFMITSNIL